MARQPFESEADHGRVLAGIGIALRMLKAKFGTQRGIAQRLGVHENTLSRWKRGAADVPNGKLIELFELAGVSMDEAFGLHGRVREKPGRESTALSDADYVIERVLAAMMRLSGGPQANTLAPAVLQGAGQIGRAERQRAIEVITQFASAGLALGKRSDV
jgi:transcriptional regulator with XRE-family HTH domain